MGKYKDPNYSRKYYEKNRKKILRWMKDNQAKHYLMGRAKVRSKINYNNKAKNQIRDELIEVIEPYKIKKVLTLESPQYLFTKRFPEANFYIFENIKIIYDKMFKVKPENVFLSFGDIGEFGRFDVEPDLIYLDFCGATSKESIFQLKDKISKCKLFGITLALRDKKQNYFRSPV